MFNINRWWVFLFLLFSNLIKHQLLRCKEQKTIFCPDELLTTKKFFSNMTNISICETRTSWRKMCASNWYSEIVSLFLKNEKVHVARKIQMQIQNALRFSIYLLLLIFALEYWNNRTLRNSRINSSNLNMKESKKQSFAISKNNSLRSF